MPPTLLLLQLNAAVLPNSLTHTHPLLLLLLLFVLLLLNAHQERFPEVDFSGLPDEWYSKTGHYNFLTKRSSPEGQRLLWQRMEAATEWLCGRSEQTLVISAHHTVFNFLVGIEFRNCEVYKMELVTSGPWKERWRVTEADGEVIPLYNADGTLYTWTGSGPLKGTLATCLSMTHLGPEAARLSYERHHEQQVKSSEGLDGESERSESVGEGFHGFSARCVQSHAIPFPLALWPDSTGDRRWSVVALHRFA
jgi:hypothetical protein